ncbi:hypothetical protein NKH74_27580 [Mesorhizobium sp. M0933]|uniref:hypothetical protein n=1 Tax=Mesorhizobium sp. M0933 TaxID=2957030 RepID=UPI00333AAC2E
MSRAASALTPFKQSDNTSRHRGFVEALGRHEHELGYAFIGDPGSRIESGSDTIMGQKISREMFAGGGNLRIAREKRKARCINILQS